MATSFLPATILRSAGEWPCTSALGLFTRKYSALRSNVSPLSKVTVMVLRSLCNRSSVGQGPDPSSSIRHRCGPPSAASSASPGMVTRPLLQCSSGSMDVGVTDVVKAGDNLFRSAVSTLQPASLAIVGASERARWPSEIFKNLREFGFPGRIALVNPRQKEVYGQRCFPSLRDLPEPVEHALVIVPAAAVAGVLTAAEEAGVGSATVYASMLGDGDEPESKARGAWLRDFTAKSRLRVAGPNCMGAYSYRERLFGYPNADLCRLAPGPVACIFQSGGLIQFWMKAAAERGLRYSYCITSGNEPDLGLADYLNFVIDDPHTRQVVLFVEGIRRPQAFMHAAGRALAMGNPILDIKTGVTAKSRAASRSHTGAIAGDYAAYLAMCERYGIVNHRSLDDLVETALAFEGGRLPKGPRIAFVTTSGATVDLLYDYAAAEGAAMPDFTDETKAAMLPMMQEGIAPKNPLDVGIPSTLEVAAKICETAARDPNIDMVAWASPMPRKGEAWGDVAPLRQLLTKTDKPVVGFGRVIQQLSDDHLAAQEAAGFPFLQGIEPTIRALDGLWFHAARRGRRPPTPPPAPPSDLSPATLEATLARYGIALPKSHAVANAAEAVSAAERIGFPIALKRRSLLPPAPRSPPPASTASSCRRWCRASRPSSARATTRSTDRCSSSARAACWSSSPRTQRCACFR